MSAADIVSAAAAVVSAVGGAFAAWAAFHSAGSARQAQQAGSDAEHRATLQQIGITATEVLIEERRIISRGNYLRLAYQTLFTLSGSFGGSRHKLFDSAVDKKLKLASELCNYAKLFTVPNEKLKGAPSEETDRVLLLLSNKRTEIRALREDIEREINTVEGQSVAYRDKSIKGSI